MNIYSIPLSRLAIIFIPVAVVGVIYIKWSLSAKTLGYAVLRMTIQLIAVGYALNIIFFNQNLIITSFVLLAMILSASWIALRPVSHVRRQKYRQALTSIAIGGIPVLALVVFGVVRLDPWYLPRYMIPLAGMIFANAMNSVSLCAERFISETNNGSNYGDARRLAYQTALLPLLNSFFAVGLVSIPGMMTGQILAGVSVFIAVRYQVMVMCMLLGASGIAAAVYLRFQKGSYVYE